MSHQHKAFPSIACSCNAACCEDFSGVVKAGPNRSIFLLPYPKDNLQQVRVTPLYTTPVLYSTAPGAFSSPVTSRDLWAITCIFKSGY